MMNTLELIKDAALFGGSIPIERAQEVKDYLKEVELLMSVQQQVKNIAYESVLSSFIDKRLDQLDKDIENSKPFSQSFMNLKEREAQLLKAKSLLEREDLI